MKRIYFFLKNKIIAYMDEMKPNKIDKKTIFIIVILVLFSLSGVKNSRFYNVIVAKNKPVYNEGPTMYEIYKESSRRDTISHLPREFKFVEINKDNLRRYLIDRNSLLAYDPYFSIIINTAEEFRLNPIVLFSIAGHEQGFVNKDSEYSFEIVNNPYNVFGSWKEYNTDIKDSSQIASRTIINLLKNRPENVEPFKWINRKYAEDENWYIGVKSIFKTLYNISN